MFHALEGLRISTSLQDVDFVSLHEIYESVGFHRSSNPEFPMDYMEKAFGHGVYGFFSFYDDRLVGVARVLSDDIICAWIAEICVHKDWQKKGIGHALLDQINSRFAHVALYADSLSNQVDFLQSKGIVPQSRLVACGRAPVVRERTGTAGELAET